jgi:uncharacterized protein YfdQ (DUF2303 family)
MTDSTQLSSEPAVPATMQITPSDLQPVDFNQARRLDAGIAISAPFILLKRDGLDEKASSLEQLFAAPHRARGTAQISNPDDYIAFVEAHKLPSTELFYNTSDKGAAFVAVLNGHEPSNKETFEPVPIFGWHDHRATYTTETSRQWQTWIANNNKAMKQSVFADFIETNRLDFVAPDAAALLAVAETMQAHQTAAYTGTVRQANGDIKIAYEATSKASAGERGEMIVPEKFVIGIPIFLDDAPYQIEAYFRYQIADGALKIHYQLINPTYIFEHVTEKMVSKIRAGINLPIYRGIPISSINAL